MGLVKKIKDILFEEEEYTEPIKIHEEKKEEPIKEASVSPVATAPVDTPLRPVEPKVETRTPEVTRENDLLKADNTFKFPDFDEEEFQSSMSRQRPNTNVLDIERKKKSEKRNEYARYDREARDNREPVEKKKFKPSPIISPVYGILNQDYKADDIVNKSDVINTVDIDTVRKKAFETIKEEPKFTVEEPISEPVVTFFEEKDSEVKVEDNSKTIDDLLDEASTEIPLEDTLEIPTTNHLEDIEEELEKIEEEKIDKPNKNDEDNGDIFELIDSMYENRKEDN